MVSKTKKMSDYQLDATTWKDAIIDDKLRNYPKFAIKEEIRKGTLWKSSAEKLNQRGD